MKKKIRRRRRCLTQSLVYALCVIAVVSVAGLGGTAVEARSTVWLADASLYDDHPYEGAVTARTHIKLQEYDASLTGQGIWLIGLGTERGMPPTALSLVWAETATPLGNIWTINLQSNAGVIPKHMSPLQGIGLLSGAEAVRLQILAPKWGHEYEAILGYNPATGAATIRLRDLTDQQVVFSRNLRLNPVALRVYPGAGIGQLTANSSKADLAMARVVSLDVIDAHLPVSVDWKVVQRSGPETGYSVVPNVDRRMQTAVSVNLPWDALPGTLRVAIRRDEATEHVVPLVLGSFTPVNVSHLPAGAYDWVLQYVEGDRVWDVDVQHVAIGRLTAEFPAVDVQLMDQNTLSVEGRVRIVTDGPIGAVRLTTKGTLTGHHFELVPHAAQGTFQTQIVACEVPIASLSVASQTEPQVLEMPFSGTIMVPVDAPGDRTVWELELRPELTEGAIALDPIPKTVWHAPTPKTVSPAGFLANETIQTKQLVPGVTLSTIRGVTSHGPVNMYLIEADLTLPNITVDGLVASDLIASDSAQWPLSTVSQMASRSGAVAAINANFFEIKATRNPRGMHLNSGRLLKSHNEGWNRSVGFAADGTPYFGTWHWHGIIRRPDAPTEVRGTAGLNITTAGYNDIVIFRSPWRTSPGYEPAKNGGLVVTELVITGLSESEVVEPTVNSEPRNARIIHGTVREVRVGQPGIAITDELLVVTGYGSAGKYLEETYSIGDEIEILYSIIGETAWPGLEDWRDLVAAVSGNVVILRNGRYGDSAVLNNTELMPRTVVATTQDQSTLYWLVVDGRSTFSVGMTYKELADFLLHIGAFHAQNLDGGGSSELVVKDPTTDRFTIVNQPSDGFERPVPDSLAIFFTHLVQDA